MKAGVLIVMACMLGCACQSRSGIGEPSYAREVAATGEALVAVAADAMRRDGYSPADYELVYDPGHEVWTWSLQHSDMTAYFARHPSIADLVGSGSYYVVLVRPAAKAGFTTRDGGGLIFVSRDLHVAAVAM